MTKRKLESSLFYKGSVMQNIDLYTGPSGRQDLPEKRYEPVFYSAAMAESAPRERDRRDQKANRTVFLVIFTAVICFSIGYFAGIKYSGNQSQMIDDTTYEALGNLKEKVSGLAAGITEEKKQTFPVADFPYMVRIGQDVSMDKAKGAAEYLSSKGHRVILTGSGSSCKIYTGPYKTLDEAQSALKKIDTCSEYKIAGSTGIIRRK